MFSNAIPRMNLLSRLSLLGMMVLFMTTSTSCTKLFQDAQSLSGFMNIKNQALSLIGKATGNYSDHTGDIAALTKTMNDQISYEEGRGVKNKKTVEMLKLMMDQDSYLLGSLLSKWKSAGSLKQPFVDEMSRVVGRNFDKIIDLEKSKPSS